MSEAIKHTILVVDDTPENIEILVGILGDEYKVKVAINGEKALAIANSDSPPELILLDIMMPNMDGFEVCKRLKENPKTSEIPVIFVTAKGETEDESRGFELGASDYITKPISAPIVKVRVKTHLELFMKNRMLNEKVEELQKSIRILDNKLKRVSSPKRKEKKQEPKEEVKIYHFEEYFLDDHKEDLVELEEELEANINLLCLNSKLEPLELQKTSKYFFRYGQILTTYPIFKELGEGLIVLSEVLSKDDLEPNESSLSMAFGCLETLIFTLKRWREEIFSAHLENPNVYDNSMLSDIKTISLALENKLEEVESDIEFF